MNIYHEQATSYFAQLHRLRLDRARKAGIDVSTVPGLDDGGDYILAEILIAAGQPETDGWREKEALRMGRESSRASAV